MAYEDIAGITQITTLLYFVGIFAAVLVYALWPNNKKRFDAASRIPLRED